MKEINDKNLDAWLFEYFEGDLSEAESEHLLREVGNNKDFIEEFNYWKQSYLKEYPSIQYSYSDKLKKKPLWKTYWPSLPAIALAIFLIGYFDFSKKEDINSSNTKNSGNKTFNKSNTQIINSVSNDNHIGKGDEIVKTNSNASKFKIKIHGSQRAKEVSGATSTEVKLVKDTTIINENITEGTQEINVVIEENKISNKVTETAPKQTIKPEEKENKNVKPKPLKLKNIHLKPAEEINKMNSDF